MDNLMVINALMVVLFIVMFVVVKKRYPVKFNTRDMVVVGVLIAISVIVSNYLSISLPPSNPVFKIGFGSIPMMAIGLVFGPVYGLIAGIIIDLLGVLASFSAGITYIPFLGFTLNSVITCMLPGIFMIEFKNRSHKFFNVINYGLITLFWLGSITFVMTSNTLAIDKFKTDLTGSLRITVIAILTIFSIILVLTSYFMNKKYQDNQKIKIGLLIFLVLVIEMINNFTLTPTWLLVMYQIPYDITIMPRVLKAILMNPINIYLIYYISNRILKKYIKI